MEDCTNTLFDIRKKTTPVRIAPLPPLNSQMSKQPTNHSRYGILSSKIFQPNLRRQNAVKKKSAPPRPPPPILNSLGKSQSISSLGTARNNNRNGHSIKLKPSITDACLIDLSSPPNSPYAGSGSDGVSINSFGSENSSNNHSASEDVFDPFGLVCEEPQTAGLSSFYSRKRGTFCSNNKALKSWDDDDPFKEIAQRHDQAEQSTPPIFPPPNNHVRKNNIIPKLVLPAQVVNSTFYTKETSSKPIKMTIIRPKNQVKKAANLSHISKYNIPPIGNEATDGKKIKPEKEVLLDVLYDFVAAEPGDLSIKAGETIEFIRKINDDWLYGKNSLGEGMFPKSFIKIISPKPDECWANRQGHQNNVTDSPKVIVKALYTFPGEVSEDLPIQEGENIHVLGKINDEWLYGEVNCVRGQFPASFVEKVLANLPPWVSPS